MTGFNFREPIDSFQPRHKQSIGFCATGNFELDCSDCFHYIGVYYQEKTIPTELRRNNYSVSRQTKGVLKNAVSTHKF